MALGLAASPPARAADSVYTSLKAADCRTIERNAEGAGSVQECRGRDGYRVLVAADDARSWLRIVAPRGITADFREASEAAAPGHFPNVAEAMLEWRYGDRRDRPAALIHRITATAGDAGRKTSVLLVIRVTDDRLCAIGHAVDNEAARALADGPRGCR